MTEEPYKRFMVFAGNIYDSPVGLSGLVASYDTLEEALKDYGEPPGLQCYVTIFDRIKGVTVYDEVNNPSSLP